MTLNEAIEYYDNLAEECRRKASIERNDYMDLRDESAECRQLSNWLAELAVLREKVNSSEIPNSLEPKQTESGFTSCINRKNMHDRTTDDLISRQAAIDALETIGYDFSDSGLSEIELEEVCEAVGDVRQDMINIIKRLPSAQPERIKGHWIEIALSDHTYKCSVCGRLLVNITDGKNNVTKNYPYCHCGADMRGEQAWMPLPEPWKGGQNDDSE